MAMSMFGRGAKGAAGMAVKSMQNSSKATGFKASYKMADTQKINLLPPLHPSRNLSLFFLRKIHRIQTSVLKYTRI